MQQHHQPVKSYDPHKEPIFKFIEDTQKFLKSKTVWRYSCGGWYHDENGYILQWWVWLARS